MLEADAKKLRELEKHIQRLEHMVMLLQKRVDYHERDRQRIRNDLNQIAGVIRRL